MKKLVSEYPLYRWRFAIGYTVAALLVGTIFVFAAMYLPNGLRAEEKLTAIASGSLSYEIFDPQLVVNLPYLLLQRASFAIFDVSIFTIKLPSILLGVLAMLGVFLLIREWFKKNIAITTGIVAITMPAMIFAAQDGTPTILMLAVSVWLLLSATYVTRLRKPALFWKLLTFFLLSINLYVPLGMYLNLAVITTMIFHPHIRLVMRRMNVHHVIIGLASGLVVTAPLIYSVSTDLGIGATMLGIPEAIGSLKSAAISLATILFGSYGQNVPPIAPPIVSTGVLAVVIIGIYRFIMIKHTARSYIIWFWALTIVPLVFLNQQYATYLLPLIILMIAMGLNTLINEWYKMFPRNPYARIIGLVPLGLIVGGIAISGLARYDLAYTYTPTIANRFDDDSRILQSALSAADRVGDNEVFVAVEEAEMPFYELVARYGGGFKPTTSLDVPTPVIVSSGHPEQLSIEAAPTEIFTNSKSDDSARFYLYTSL